MTRSRWPARPRSASHLDSPLAARRAAPSAAATARGRRRAPSHLGRRRPPSPRASRSRRRAHSGPSHSCSRLPSVPSPLPGPSSGPVMNPSSDIDMYRTDFVMPPPSSPAPMRAFHSGRCCVGTPGGDDEAGPPHDGSAWWWSCRSRCLRTRLTTVTVMSISAGLGGPRCGAALTDTSNAWRRIRQRIRHFRQEGHTNLAAAPLVCSAAQQRGASTVHDLCRQRNPTRDRSGVRGRTHGFAP